MWFSWKCFLRAGSRVNPAEVYGAAAAGVLIAHLLWILWVMFGAIWTRDRPLLAWFHVASLGWGILAELGPWSCPLTLAEQFFEAKAGADPYHGAFPVHYLDAMIYPDIPEALLASLAVVVCALNLAIYGRRFYRRISA
jgi:Protein of Unknown function (DUF2784)